MAFHFMYTSCLGVLFSETKEENKNGVPARETVDGG